MRSITSCMFVIPKSYDWALLRISKELEAKIAYNVYYCKHHRTVTTLDTEYLEFAVVGLSAEGVYREWLANIPEVANVRFWYVEPGTRCIKEKNRKSSQDSVVLECVNSRVVVSSAYKEVLNVMDTDNTSNTANDVASMLPVAFIDRCVAVRLESIDRLLREKGTDAAQGLGYALHLAPKFLYKSEELYEEAMKEFKSIFNWTDMSLDLFGAISYYFEKTEDEIKQSFGISGDGALEEQAILDALGAVDRKESCVEAKTIDEQLGNTFGKLSLEFNVSEGRQFVGVRNRVTGDVVGSLTKEELLELSKAFIELAMLM